MTRADRENAATSESIGNRSMDKIELRCPHCGSANIFKDAAAAWDAEAQEWTLVSVHDHETCEDCDRSGDYMAERRTLGAAD
jgi:hypothetical protein